MIKFLNKLRILGSGFTREEYNIYQFDNLDNPHQAMQYLSNRLNHDFFQRIVNRSVQKHLLEDKWVIGQYLTCTGLPVAKTYGVYHPVFGETSSGMPMQTPEHVAQILQPDLPIRLFIKPRGGRQGRNVIAARLSKNDDGNIIVSSNNSERTLKDFLDSLPHDAFGDYGGAYHGWLIQAYIRQHDFLERINPHTINTLRIITFIDAQEKIRVQHAILRLGHREGIADNWEKGGISVAVDVSSGRLGRGVYKPRYGGNWVSEHPDTGIHFEGQTLPEWPALIDLCKRAAAQFSGIRTVGWDIALSSEGPVIIEGNADWGLPSIQIHTRGYLTQPVRRELAEYGLQLPERAKSLPMALLFLLINQLQRSRAPRLLKGLTSLLYLGFDFISPKSTRPRIRS